MRNIVVSLSLAILASGVALTCQSAVAETYTEKTIEQGPAQVVDSWMQPTVVRSRAIKDADGDVSHVEEPLIMERHERVIVPTTETTKTTNVYQQPSVVRTEKQQVSYTATKKAAAPARAKKKYVARKKSKPRAVAHKQRAKRNYVAQKVNVTEEKVVRNPTVIEQTEQSVHKETLIERRDPALELH